MCLRLTWRAVKHRLLDSTTRISDSVDLSRSPRICISNKFLGVADAAEFPGPHCKSSCFRHLRFPLPFIFSEPYVPTYFSCSSLDMIYWLVSCHLNLVPTITMILWMRPDQCCVHRKFVPPGSALTCEHSFYFLSFSGGLCFP